MLTQKEGCEVPSSQKVHLKFCSDASLALAAGALGKFSIRKMPQQLFNSVAFVFCCKSISQSTCQISRPPQGIYNGACRALPSAHMHAHAQGRVFLMTTPIHVCRRQHDICLWSTTCRNCRALTLTLGKCEFCWSNAATAAWIEPRGCNWHVPALNFKTIQALINVFYVCNKCITPFNKIKRVWPGYISENVKRTQRQNTRRNKILE